MQIMVLEVYQTFIENRNVMAPAEYSILSLSDRRDNGHYMDFTKQKNYASVNSFREEMKGLQSPVRVMTSLKMKTTCKSFLQRDIIIWVFLNKAVDLTY